LLNVLVIVLYHNQLEEPVKQIAVNAGLEPAVIVNKVKESEAGIGFDAANKIIIFFIIHFIF